MINLHRKGNGYKKIAKMLNIPRDTIGSIIRKFKAKGTVETLPGRGRKNMLTATAVRYLKRRVEKSPRVTAEELRQYGAPCVLKASMPELPGAPPCCLQRISVLWKIRTVWAHGSTLCLEEEKQGL